MKDYAEFLDKKKDRVEPVGFSVELDQLNDKLKPFQSAIVKWSLSRGRAALFCDTGLGKTFMQLEWANHVCRKTDMPVLIFAPLAVAPQTVTEAEKFGIKSQVKVVANQDECISGINVTNYDKMHHFDASKFSGLVLDESSILKNYTGRTRNELIKFARTINYRLACSATPAPNDIMELANHSEFLDAMSGKEIIANYFIQDGNTAHKWRLKKHAEGPFWEFVSTWSIAVRKPSDIGFDDAGYILPEPVYHEHVVSSKINDGFLFPMQANTMGERRKARSESIDDRCKMVAEIVAKEPDKQWLIWCDLNAESELLKKLIPNSIDVKGSDKNEFKEKNLLGFKDGKPQNLISKPSICGHGMNWQHCSRMVFVGLSDSFEKMYQGKRRIWRFGQEENVHIHVVTAESEGAVVQNIKRKERESNNMYNQIIKHMGTNDLYVQRTKRTVMLCQIIQKQ